MIVISLDTNFVTPRFIHGGKRNNEANLLDRMLFLQSKGLLKISLHKATQAEIYAILRVGRIRVKGSEGKRVQKKFPHHVIMHFVHKYNDLFDEKFMDSLDKVGFEDQETYKELLFTEVKYHLNMSIDQSKKYIENKGISLEGCNDPYDFHIMVTALKDKSDYLLTTNTGDFPNPLGFCKIINVEELLSVLPIYP